MGVEAMRPAASLRTLLGIVLFTAAPAMANAVDGDLYAGRDGNVYKRDNGSWQKYDNGGWNRVDTQTRNTTSSAEAQARRTEAQRDAQSRASSAQTQARRSEIQRQGARQFQTSGASGSDVVGQLERESRSRAKGQQRTQDFQKYKQRSSRRSRSGGSRGRGG